MLHCAHVKIAFLVGDDEPLGRERPFAAGWKRNPIEIIGNVPTGLSGRTIRGQFRLTVFSRCANSRWMVSECFASSACAKQPLPILFHHLRTISSPLKAFRDSTAFEYHLLRSR